jgi:hypothetical protein
LAMPKSYSLDLRERVVRFVEEGRSRRAAAAHFKVSVSFVVNLVKAVRARGASNLSPAPADATPSSNRIGRFFWRRSRIGRLAALAVDAPRFATRSLAHATNSPWAKKPLRRSRPWCRGSAGRPQERRRTGSPAPNSGASSARWRDIFAPAGSRRKPLAPPWPHRRLWPDKSSSTRRRGPCGLSRRRNPSNDG